jgi:hypothetical protein
VSGCGCGWVVVVGMLWLGWWGGVGNAAKLKL